MGLGSIVEDASADVALRPPEMQVTLGAERCPLGNSVRIKQIIKRRS